MNPDEYLGLGFLTDDTQNPLYNHNYDHFHRSCLRHWNELQKLNEMLNELQESGKWGGDGLKKLIEDFNSLV